MRNGAVFLDRDGTINETKRGNLKTPRELKLVPGAGQSVQKLNKLGFKVIIITNQPVIARGLATKKEVERINAALTEKLSKRGAHIDAIYYCPHHPEATLRKYRKRCYCRKPNIGLIQKAIRKFKIDKRDSFIIGDSTGDVLAGKRARLTTILVKTGQGGLDGKHKVKPDIVVSNISEAVRFIAKIKP